MKHEDTLLTEQKAKSSRGIKWGNVLKVAIVAIGGFIALVSENNAPKESCPFNTTIQREILNSNIQVYPLWSLSLRIENFAYLTNVVASPDLLVAAVHCSNTSITSNRIHAFDLQTGKLKWSSEPITNIYNIMLGSRNLAVSTVDQISLYSIETGKVIWANNSSALINSFHLLQLLPDNRLIAYVGQSGMYWVDEHTGDIQTAIPAPSHPVSLLYDQGTVFTFTGDVIEAYAVKKNLLLWTFPLNNRTEISLNAHHAHVEGNFLLIHWGGNGRYISVLNKTTGKLVWEYKDSPVVSNVLVNNKTAYLLDSQARLLLFDIETGTNIGRIQFTQRDKQSDSLNQQGSLSGSWLAVQDNVVAIYFQDTEVLSTYRILSTSE